MLSSTVAVHIRPLAASDVSAVHQLLSNAAVVRYMLFPICTQEQTEKFVRDSIAGGVECWRSCDRAIVDEATGELIGLCGIGMFKGAEEGELWYLLDPARQGRGLATEATAQLLDVAFNELGLHRVRACCVPANPASARVLEKLGMRREGYQLRNLKIQGQWEDSFLYAILAEEWRGRTR